MADRGLSGRRRTPGVLLAWLVWALWLLGLPLLLLGLALLFGIVFVQDYKDRIAEVASELIDREVRIESIRIVPRAPLGVALVLSGVEVVAGDPAGSFRLRDLRLDVDLPRTLAAQALVPDGVRIVGLDGMVSRDADGVLRIVGFIPGGGRLRPDLILADGDVEIRDSTLVWRGPDGEEQPFRIDALTLSDEGSDRVVEGRLALPAGWGDEVRVGLRWPGPDVSAPSVPPERIDWTLSAPAVRIGSFAGVADSGSGLRLVGLSASGSLGSPALPWPVPESLAGPAGPLRLSGTVELTADGVEFEQDAVFPNVLTADGLDTGLVWQWDTAGWQLTVPRLRISHALGMISGRGRLEGGDGSARIDLDLDLDGNDDNLAGVANVLPLGVMGPRLGGWLVGAFSTGHLRSAGLRWRGSLPGGPDAGPADLLSFQARLEDARLDYRPGWPSLEAVTAGLTVTDTGLVIEAERGRVGSVALDGVRADLAAYTEGLLEVDGAFSGEGDDLLALLQTLPPIPDPVIRTIRGFRLSGRHPGRLALSLPLRGGRPTFAGHVDLSEAELDWVDQRLRFSDLDGRVRFSEAGIRSDGVRFETFGGRARLAIEHTPAGPDSRITLRGQLEQARLDRISERLPALDFLSGRSDLGFELGLPGFRSALQPAVLQVDSDLLGAASTLPAPADKAAGEVELLTLSMQFGAVPGPLRFELGERLSGLLVWNGQQPERLGIGLGQAAPEPLVPGVLVRGRASELDPLAWLRRNSGEPPLLALRELDLVVERFRLGDRSLGEVAIEAGARDGTMLMTLEGPALAGSLNWDRDRPVPLSLYLQRFLWPAPEPAAATASSPRTVQDSGSLRPGQWPALELRVDRLEAGRWPLGALDLEAGPDADGGYRSTFGLVTGNGRLNGSGHWQAGPEGGTNRYALELQSSNAGALLDELGLAGLVTGGQVEGKADLVWPGPPGVPRLDRLGGQVRLGLDGIRLQPVDPGAGRLLGLISISSIPRRLFLDFSDVLRPGFLVDRLRANIDILDGVARSDDFWMQGASARIELDGAADLVERTLDLTVAVLPKTSAAMPLVGGLLGGPPGAAALFLVEQLIREQVDRVTRMRYRIDGPWSEPRIERITRDETADDSP